ncbi:MAG: hypothetical protein RLZ26_2460, partial [Pseudomonadota bacterium]
MVRGTGQMVDEGLPAARPARGDRGAFLWLV